MYDRWGTCHAANGRSHDRTFIGMRRNKLKWLESFVTVNKSEICSVSARSNCESVSTLLNGSFSVLGMSRLTILPNIENPMNAHC